MPVQMSREDFESCVDAALDEIPDDLATLVENCAVVIEDHPPPGAEDLLGLYEGVPLTERDSHYSGVLPDRISIFRVPLLEYCNDVDELVDEIHITVVHEIAHHFGIDDERLHALGYG